MRLLVGIRSGVPAAAGGAEAGVASTSEAGLAVDEERPIIDDAAGGGDDRSSMTGGVQC
jgi:hypothetical protein